MYYNMYPGGMYWLRWWMWDSPITDILGRHTILKRMPIRNAVRDDDRSNKNKIDGEKTKNEDTNKNKIDDEKRK